MYEEYQTQEHPFAKYTRILGKGKHGTRSLTENEAFDAFTMILNKEVLPEQLGAFMMLLRVKEESVDELVGFVKAVKQFIQLKQSINQPIQPKQQGNEANGYSLTSVSQESGAQTSVTKTSGAQTSITPISTTQISVDLDWSSYAGKKKHHAWYLLSALTLAKHGTRVCMHGARGHTIGRVYSEDLLSAMTDMPKLVAHDLADVGAMLDDHNFCYVPLPLLQPTLNDIINMRNVFGLRSPVHTLSRLINPFNAPTTMQSIFHPAYQASHLLAGEKLGYQNSMVIKGDGGEFERNPDARTKVMGLKNGSQYEFRLPMLNSPKSEIETDLSQDMLQRVWQDTSGQKTPKYALQAITETLSLVLIALQKASSYEQAVPMALDMWQSRHD